MKAEEKIDVPGQGKVHVIIVNAEQKKFRGSEITFFQVVELAFGSVSTNPNIVYTVTYKKGAGRKPEGTMDKDDVVKVKDGTIFHATQTDKS